MINCVVQVSESPALGLVIDDSSSQMLIVDGQINNLGVGRIDRRLRAPLHSAEPLVHDLVLFSATEMRHAPRILFGHDKSPAAIGSDFEEAVEIKGVKQAVTAAFGTAIDGDQFSVGHMIPADGLAVGDDQYVFENRVEGDSSWLRDVANDGRRSSRFEVDLHDVLCGNNKRAPVGRNGHSTRLGQ